MNNFRDKTPCSLSISTYRLTKFIEKFLKLSPLSRLFLFYLTTASDDIEINLRQNHESGDSFTTLPYKIKRNCINRRKPCSVTVTGRHIDTLTHQRRLFGHCRIEFIACPAIYFDFQYRRGHLSTRRERAWRVMFDGCLWGNQKYVTRKKREAAGAFSSLINISMFLLFFL